MQEELLMINKISRPKFLQLLICLICAMPVVHADQAVLSSDLKLHIPVIRFQGQYLWADLDYTENLAGEAGFSLKNYGFIATEGVPPELSDLSEVTEGAEPAIVDITDTEARLTFISSVPLACSVIYGKTSAFGAVAVDANMNGGAIIDHNPVLTNMQPGSLYYYRVQGADAQGKLYWSPVGSFTTATESVSDNLLSIANGATISAVSSNFGQAQNDQTWGANSAVDGSSNSAWSSAGDGDNAFIEISLASAEQINTLEVWSRSMNDGSAKIFSFTITLEGAEVLGPFTLPDTVQAYQFPIGRVSSFIRFDVATSSGGNTGLVELSAY